jgi:LacI family transcriptional regulator
MPQRDDEAVAAGRPTMHDVALAAGVSLKTVSRVVNQEGYVAPATARRVEDAIAQTRFRRNELARSIRAGQTSKDIGLLLGDLSNPFFADVASAIIRGARARSYTVVLASADDDPEAERAAIDGLLGRRVAGLIIVPDTTDYAFLAHEVALGTQVVFIDRPGTGVDATSVLLANYEGATIAVEHLINEDFKRIGIVVAPSRYSTAERLRGYRDAMRRATGAVDESLIKEIGVGTIAAAEAAARELLALPDPPDAIFATTGFLTQGVLRALGRRRDIGLVGFDDFPLADRLPTPLTVVASRPQELGSEAIAALFDRLDGVDIPERRIIQTTLVTRGSGEARRRRSAALRVS